jgi:hypothetical protein
MNDAIAVAELLKFTMVRCGTGVKTDLLLQPLNVLLGYETRDVGFHLEKNAGAPGTALEALR